MRDDQERIRDILESIENIEKYAAAGQGKFNQDELIQTWTIHHLQIIGEAAARLTEQFKERHPEIPWFQVIGMRNILIHRYFGIDKEIVWEVVEKDIPALKENLKLIL